MRNPVCCDWAEATNANEHHAYWNFDVSPPMAFAATGGGPRLPSRYLSGWEVAVRFFTRGEGGTQVPVYRVDYRGKPCCSIPPWASRLKTPDPSVRLYGR